MTPMEPKHPQPDPADPRWSLRDAVIRAINALPGHFSSPIQVENMPLPDLHSLNTGLGGAIERETVDVLNRIRNIWDPEGQWNEYRFVRYSQRFPDVRLVKNDGQALSDIAFGIELKGWFILAKEGEPSFRFTTNPAACAPLDLIVVVPWYLDRVLGGSPGVLSPYVDSALFIAQMRNHWWRHVRKVQNEARDSRVITHPKDPLEPYPRPKSKCNDSAKKDSGGNFGRIARIERFENGRRVGIVDAWLRETMGFELAGVAVEHWRAFSKALVDGTSTETRIENIRRGLARCSIERRAEIGDTVIESLLTHVEEAVALASASAAAVADAGEDALSPLTTGADEAASDSVLPVADLTGRSSTDPSVS